MQGLERIQTTTQEVKTKNVVSKKGISQRAGSDRGTKPKVTLTLPKSQTAVDISASLKTRLEQELKSAGSISDAVSVDSHLSALRKTFPEWIREILTELKDDGQTAALSETNTQTAGAGIDSTFGVEPLSYKNMWKVLKTVVREIGVIKEAYHGRFFLGVSERIDKATTLMEFSSLTDYLDEHANDPLKNKLSGTPKDTIKQVLSNPTTSLQIQANIAPEAALQLLTLTG